MILEIKDLNVTYNSKSASPNAAVRGVSFALEENTFSGLIGESGSGKSTQYFGIAEFAAFLQMFQYSRNYSA